MGKFRIWHVYEQHQHGHQVQIIKKVCQHGDPCQSGQFRSKAGYTNSHDFNNQKPIIKRRDSLVIFFHARTIQPKNSHSDNQGNGTDIGQQLKGIRERNWPMQPFNKHTNNILADHPIGRNNEQADKG